METVIIENRHLKRVLAWGGTSLRSTLFYAGSGREPLIDPAVADEASVTIDGCEYLIGAPDGTGFSVHCALEADLGIWTTG